MDFDSTALSEEHPDFPFVNAVREGDTVYVSGQISIDQGGAILKGKVRADNSNMQVAVTGAELCAIGCLRAAASIVAYEDITKVLQMIIIVRCEEDFEKLPLVGNGASELLVDLLGAEVGMGTRMTFGGIPPYGAIVEIAMTLAVKPIQ